MNSDGKVSLFTPFEWGVTPIGEQKSEAKAVAWALTLAAFAPEAFPPAAKKLCYGCHLENTVPKLNGISKRLVALGSTPITLEEIETELGDDFWPEVFPVGRAVDPHYWQSVINIFRNSVESMLTKLDISLSSLAGMDFEQTTAGVYSDICGVKSVIKTKLVEAMLSKKPNAVLHCLYVLRAEMLPSRVDVVKTRLKKQIAGVTALQRVLRASLAGAADHAILANEDDLRVAFMDPPECMVQDLARKNVHMAVPYSCFLHLGNGTSAPMSASTKHSILRNWIDANAVCVGEVCASTLSLLKRLVSVHEDDRSWSQITVCKYDPQMRQEPPFDTVAHCPLPDHLAPQHDLVLVAAPQADNICVRAARLFDTLIQLAKKGLLVQRQVRADKILPLFARVEVEQNNVLQTTLSDVAEIGYQHGVPFCRAKRQASASPEVSDDETEGAVVQHPKTTVLSVLSDTVCVGVRKELERDHAILKSICMLVKSNKAQSIRLKEVAGVFEKIAPHIYSNPRSLNQAISKVATKVIEYFNDSKQPGYAYGEVRYDNARNRATDGQVGGIVVDAHGASTFLKYCNFWCSRMQTGDKSVVTDWKPSRASLAQAVHVQQRRRHGSRSGTKSRANKSFEA